MNRNRTSLMRSAWPVVACATIVLATLPLGTAFAQEAAGKGGALNYSLIDLVRFGGWVGYLIILMSIVAVSLIVQYALSLREKTLVPADELASIREMVAMGEYERVESKGAEAGASFLAKVVADGVSERDRGYDAVIKAMEDSADEQTGRMLRRIEHLNIIANIAPMLGLLGTVMGMVNSFNQISVAVGGVDPRRLAGGIFEALMTTVMGLIVAIPSLYAFGVFRNRVDSLVADASTKAGDIVEPLKPRSRSAV